MLANLQILRAYAALSVAFFHINVPDMAFGSFGVHIFFVISGFIIALACQTHPEWFFLRRLIRIIPAYWACTLGVFFIACFFPNLLNFTTADGGNLLKSLFFIPYRKESGLMQPLLNVGWTLNYEMFFYLIVSISLWIVGRKFAPLLACAALIAVINLLPRICSTDVCVFYADSISYEFCYGIAAYYLWRFLSGKNPVRFFWVACCIVLLLVFPLLEITQFNRGGFNMATASFLLVLAAVMSENGLPTWKKRLVIVGDASYLIYLIHIYIIQAFNKMLVPVFPIFSLQSPVGVIACLASLVAVSILLHLYVEKPVLKWLKQKLIRPRQHVGNESH